MLAHDGSRNPWQHIRSSGAFGDARAFVKGGALKQSRAAHSRLGIQAPNLEVAWSLEVLRCGSGTARPGQHRAGHLHPSFPSSQLPEGKERQRLITATDDFFHGNRCLLQSTGCLGAELDPTSSDCHCCCYLYSCFSSRLPLHPCCRNSALQPCPVPSKGIPETRASW